jgi:uncharacterized protein (TIGR02145 family)
MKKIYLLAIILLAFSVYMGCIKDDYTFNCGETFIDPMDGQNYNTVLIGDQCWMAENLNVGTMIENSENMSNDGIIEKYCFKNNPSNCDKYGGLYQWNEMMKYTSIAGARGICPDRWHLPSDDEWMILEGTVDSQYPVGSIWGSSFYRGYDVGVKLKSINGWISDGRGTNDFLFTAIASGILTKYGDFKGLGQVTYFWTSSNSRIDNAWHRALSYDHDNVYRRYYSKGAGLSVRCLRD